MTAVSMYRYELVRNILRSFLLPFSVLLQSLGLSLMRKRILSKWPNSLHEPTGCSPACDLAVFRPLGARISTLAAQPGRTAGLTSDHRQEQISHRVSGLSVPRCWGIPLLEMMRDDAGRQARSDLDSRLWTLDIPVSRTRLDPVCDVRWVRDKTPEVRGCTIMPTTILTLP